MNIQARELGFRQLNQQIQAAAGDVRIDGCIGQRFIGTGLSGQTLTIHGIPGNALGAYLNGATIHVCGNVQDAVGDTMNEGCIVVDGDAGDALGYAMCGGSIFVKGNAGYRTGIHMKEYKQKKPVIVIGGKVGSFLGEYLAGGLIVVLGLGSDEVPVGNFTGTGMHGGSIFICTDKEPAGLPEQVTAAVATAKDLEEIAPWVEKFAQHFGQDASELMKKRFWLLRPNAKNPYHQLYTPN